MPLLAAPTRLKAELDALRPPAAEQASQLLEQQLEYSHHTTVTGENDLTLAETRALLLHGLTAASKPLQTQVAVQNHHRAVLQLEARAHTTQPLTARFIGELHGTLLGCAPSPYKSAPNNVLTAEGKTLYFSSPEDVRARLADLLAWYQRETAHPTLPPLVLAAQLHHRFARIRPFKAGNGRLARLLLNLVLRHHGYPLIVVKAADRAKYAAASVAVAKGEPEPFLQFLADRITAALLRQLRAFKGKPVDESSELQTKLALLKQQVLGREDAVKTLWNEAAQATIYEALVKPLLIDLLRQTQDFNDLFMSRGYIGSVESALPIPLPLVLDEEGDWETFEAHFSTATTLTKAEIKALRFTTRWLHFRQRHNGFDAGLRIDFHFRPDHFVISQAIISQHGSAPPAVHWQAEVLQLGYLPVYDEPTWHELNLQLASRFCDFIANQAASHDQLA